MSPIVEFNRLYGGEELTFGLAGAGEYGKWDCTPDEGSTLTGVDAVAWGANPTTAGAAVRDAGVVLRAKLDSLPSLKLALATAFATQAPARQPIYFRVGSPGLEVLPFEAVYDGEPNGFICLDPRWPIARLPADVGPTLKTAPLAPTLRLSVVLAAKGIEPMAHLRALAAVCREQPHLRLSGHVLANRDDVITEVRTWGASWTADPVPATPDAFVRAIKEARPHLLHILCHGVAEHNPRLLIGQRSDLGCIEVTANHLGLLAQPANAAPWLTTLACCESGAAGGPETASLAAALVRAGLPAVIGMRRPIDARMAESFSGSLYEAVLAKLAAISNGGRNAQAVEWATVLYEPRRRLAAAFGAPTDVAARQKEWTMPVLYLAHDLFALRGRPTAILSEAEVEKEIEALAYSEQSEASGIPTDYVDKLRQLSLDRLYPES